MEYRVEVVHEEAELYNLTDLETVTHLIVSYEIENNDDLDLIGKMKNLQNLYFSKNFNFKILDNIKFIKMLTSLENLKLLG